MPSQHLSDQSDRVRRHTPAELTQRIDRETERSIQFYSAQPDDVIAERIEHLKREWSIERYLQVKVAAFGLLTAGMAFTRKRLWAVLTCAGLGLFLYHALAGYEPPILLLRRMGIRTRKEIDREIYALKAMRGDFDQVPDFQPAEADFPANKILGAVDA